MLVTILSSKFGEKVPGPAGRVAGEIHDVLDRFNGVAFLPNVLHQIRGHLRYFWSSEDFVVEVDPDDPCRVFIRYEGDDLESLRRLTPKCSRCGGTGNIGVISTYRCPEC